MKDKRAAAKSNTEIKKRDKQTITAVTTEINIETKRAASFEFRKNIKLLTVIQMMLKVLFIF